MASSKVLLLQSLEDLETADIKKFQWHLENLKNVPKCKMENAERCKTVDNMVDQFGLEEAVKITVEILRTINKNNQAEQLENNHKQAQAEGRTEDPEPVGAISKPMGAQAEGRTEDPEPVGAISKPMGAQAEGRTEDPEPVGAISKPMGAQAEGRTEDPEPVGAISKPMGGSTKSEDRTQVSDLLEKIDDMVEANGESFYSCKMSRQMEREKQEQQMKIQMDRVRETEELMNKLKEEKERMKMMMEEEQNNHDKERKRREEELKKEMREQEKHQREIQDEMIRERETFKHEIAEMKEEKEKLQIKYNTEIDRLVNKIENERNKKEEYIEREDHYKAQIKEKEREICEEMKREREEWAKQKMEEKMRKEEEEKRREREQRERMEREKEDLQSKHEAKENKIKIMMEEERQNYEKERKRREEELKEREEQYKRAIKEQEVQMRDTMKREREELEKKKMEEKMRKEEEEKRREREQRERMEREKEDLQSKHEAKENKMKIMMEEERQNYEKERKRREEELKEREEQYKRAIKEQEVQMRDTMKREREELEKKKMEEKMRKEEEEKRREREQRERMEREREELEKKKMEEKMRKEEEEKRREREQRVWDDFNERLKQERERMERDKEDLQSKHEAKENKMKIMMEEERQNHDKERKRREEELKEREEQYKRTIKEQDVQMRDTMKREREEWEKQKQRREKEKQNSEEQIQRLKIEMEGIIREKERIERERREQLEDLEKRLKEERNVKEDQQNTSEEKQKLLKKQHEDELKRRRVEWREEYEREKEEMMKICTETDHSLQVATYSKLKTEYSKWSWSLRSAMMETENKLHNKIENEAIHEVEETDLQRELKKTSEKVEKSMSEFFEKDTDADILIQWKSSFEIKIKDLQENIVRETKRKLNEILQQRDLKRMIDALRTHHENTLYEKSKTLALKLKDKINDEETLKKEFDLFWKQCVKKIITDTPLIRDIDIMRDVREILSDVYGCVSVDHWKESRDIFSVPSYSDYVELKGGFFFRLVWGSLSKEDEAQIRALLTDVAQHTNKEIQSFNISKMGYNKSCIQQLTDYIKASIVQHEEGSVNYIFKNEFFRDLVYSIYKKANQMITDQHRLFRDANDPVIYVEKKRAAYYSIFQKHCHGATSTFIFGKIICQKLKEPIKQSVYKKTDRDLSGEMRSNCESLNGNRSNLEKHILKTLAEEEDFDKYMNYIHNPRDHFKSFIRDEVSQYITDKFSVSVSHKMKKNIKLLQQKIMKAAHESAEHVQVNRGDVGLWLKSFTQQLSGVLIFSGKDLRAVKHDVYDFNLLEDVIREELPTVMSDISSILNGKTFPVKLDYKFRPDEILIDHFCQCCWVQCPFCGAVCTNIIENHPGDHSVAFHRLRGINGTCSHSTKNLCADICTNCVAYDLNCNTPDGSFVWKEIKIAGPKHVIWSLSSGQSSLPYWKWFVCRFQKDLEKHYSKTFEGKGEIPAEWRKYTKHDAIESLDKFL